LCSNPRTLTAGVFYLSPLDGSAKIIVPVGPLSVTDWTRKLNEFETMVQKPNFFAGRPKNTYEGFVLSNGTSDVIHRLSKVSEAHRKSKDDGSSSAGQDLYSWRVVVVGAPPTVSETALLTMENRASAAADRVMVEELLLLFATELGSGGDEAEALAIEATAPFSHFTSVSQVMLDLGMMKQSLFDFFTKNKAFSSSRKAFVLDFPAPLMSSSDLIDMYPAVDLSSLPCEIFEDDVQLCGCCLQSSHSRKTQVMCQVNGAELKKSQTKHRLVLGSSCSLPVPPGMDELVQAACELEVLQRIDLGRVDPMVLCGSSATIVCSSDISRYSIEDIKYYELLFCELCSALNAESSGLLCCSRGSFEDPASVLVHYWLLVPDEHQEASMTRLEVMPREV